MLENIYANINSIGGMALLSSDVKPGSIIHLDPSLLYELGIQWLNVLVLAGVLTFILYKPVKRFLRDRTERIQNELVNAKTELQNANQLKADYQSKIDNIEKEREEVLNLARKKAMERSDQILADARKEAEVIYQGALAEIEIERKNNEADVKRQLIELSSLIAGRFVETSINPAIHEKFVDEALEGWEEDLWRR